MNNTEAWKPYVDYTQAASSNCRNLAFAGIAMGWAFRLPNNQMPTAVSVAFLLLATFFLLDVLQYVVAAFVLRRWVEGRQDELLKMNDTIEGEYTKPETLDRPAFAMYCGKMGALLSAHAFLCYTFLTRL